MIDRVFYKTRAKANLKGKWIIAALIAVVLMIATGDKIFKFDMDSTDFPQNTGDMMRRGLSSLPTGNAMVGNLGDMVMPMLSLLMIPFIILFVVLAIAVQVFIMGPLSLGAYQFFRKNDLNEESRDFGQLLWAFRSPHYRNIVKVLFLMNIKLFGWYLLLIIPGIVKSYEYSMIPYILSRDPSTPAAEVFAKTREITMNRKGSLFVLDLSFLGWYILGSIPFGLGTPFVTAYSTQTKSGIFNDWIGDTRPMTQDPAGA